MFKYLFLFLFSSSLMAGTYPEHWWAPVPREGAPSWEVLPQDAGPGEVILSKRNELGILSNFAPTPFLFEGAGYASIEGFWQMMKFPENEEDPRAVLHYPFTREEVSAMTSFTAKDAGKIGEHKMKELGIDWVTYKGQKMTYCSEVPGLHFDLIRKAMLEKVKQNPEVGRILLLTGDLILKPDHHAEGCEAPEWKYYELWMEIRTMLQSQKEI
jgi:predicted NAD-dependent protein-ADP-ribosyltransferase YbiA (DUF1768 family)